MSGDFTFSPSLPVETQAHALTHSAGFFSLEDSSVITVSGADRASWLNGMVTNDTRALSDGVSVYAAVVAVKGKLITDLYVTENHGELYLTVPASRRDALMAHLDRYVVMEDVTLTAREFFLFSLQGPTANGLTPPSGITARNDRFGHGGVDVFVTSEERPTLIEWALESQSKGLLVIAGEAATESVRIRAGVARFGVDFDTSNFVQEAAITARAVSFQKGCYLGQEVVCRLEMRGQVQRRLARLRLTGSAPHRGAEVFSSGNPVGTVTSATVDGDDAVVIAMVRHAALESTDKLSVGDRAATVISTGDGR